MNREQKFQFLTEVISALRVKGSWCGETHIQKASYLIQHLLGEQAFSFILYKHGPFSFDLRDDLENMRAYDLIKYEMVPVGYGARIILNTQNAPKLTAELSASCKAAIQKAVDEIKNANVAELEQLATALYFTRDEPKGDQRVEAIVGVKPHISRADAASAVHRIDHLLTECALVA